MQMTTDPNQAAEWAATAEFMELISNVHIRGMQVHLREMMDSYFLYRNGTIEYEVYESFKTIEQILDLIEDFQPVK